MKYLTVNEIIQTNRFIIEQAGEGTIGVQDMNGIESIVTQPQLSFFGKEAYPTLWLKSAYILQKITKKHCYLDGNKRTALLCTIIFLKYNNYKLNLAPQIATDLVLEATIEPDTETEMVKIAAFIEKNSTKI